MEKIHIEVTLNDDEYYPYKYDANIKNCEDLLGFDYWLPFCGSGNTITEAVGSVIIANREALNIKFELLKT